MTQCTAMILPDIFSSQNTLRTTFENGLEHQLKEESLGSFATPEWTKNLAWHELCGGFTTFNEADFLKLDDNTITEGLALLKCP